MRSTGTRSCVVAGNFPSPVSGQSSHRLSLPVFSFTFGALEHLSPHNMNKKQQWFLHCEQPRLRGSLSDRCCYQMLLPLHPEKDDDAGAPPKTTIANFARESSPRVRSNMSRRVMVYWTETIAVVVEFRLQLLPAAFVTSKCANRPAR